MINEVAVFEGGAVAPISSKFVALADAGVGFDLGEGIRQSYGIISIKGGKWRIKYKGTEIPITNENGEPKPSIEVVLLKANNFLNKQYYKGKYAEGSNSAPDCYSLDGKVPAKAVAQPMHANCAGCPMNAFGSLISDTGVKQKACRDTKKIAVAPLFDLKNEAFGGPMLFRVPPSSLKDLSMFADAMKARGFPYNSVAVRLGFDINASHPKPTFKAIRPLTDDEAEIVLEHIHSDAVERILADSDVAPVAELPVDADFEQPPAAPVAPRPAPPPVVTAAPKEPPTPAPLARAVFGAPPAAPAPAAPAAIRVPKPPKAAPKATAPAAPAAPVAAEPADAAPPNTQLDDDIGDILKGLGLPTGN